MAEITIYTSIFCGFCWRAKRLLTDKGVDFEEIDVTMNPRARGRMSERAGGLTSVPQIFVGSQHIGGSDELEALESAGRLDPLLEQAS